MARDEEKPYLKLMVHQIKRVSTKSNCWEGSEYKIFTQKLSTNSETFTLCSRYCVCAISKYQCPLHPMNKPFCFLDLLFFINGLVFVLYLPINSLTMLLACCFKNWKLLLSGLALPNADFKSKRNSLKEVSSSRPNCFVLEQLDCFEMLSCAPCNVFRAELFFFTLLTIVNNGFFQ